MNPLHLLWIVPLSAAFGLVFMAVLQVGGSNPGCPDDDHDVSGLIDED